MNILAAPVRRTLLAGLLTTSALITWQSALADDVSNALGVDQTLTIEQASQHLRYSGGNDRFRVEVAPNYSEEFGFSLKGAAGGYLTDALALGLIVEYGEDMQEYLANAGIQFNEELSFVGTVGLLEQRYEYVAGEGKDTARQMEYGVSLKGAYEVSIFSGFELNGYMTNADADSKNVETGRLYGIQLMAGFDLTSTTNVDVGAGYEWLEWDDTNENDSQFTFSADAAQQLGDALSLTGNVKLGASEYVYGGGLAFDLSRDDLNTNRLALNYSYIDGRNGIEDDQRVELAWTYGFGDGPTQTASVDTQDTAMVRPVADVAVVSPANNLLNDVMKRPSFLPEQVIARAAGGDPGLPMCSAVGINLFGPYPALQSNSDALVITQAPNTTLQLAGVYMNDASPDIPLTVNGISFEYFQSFLKGYQARLDPGPFVVGQKYTLTFGDTQCSVIAVAQTIN